MKSKLLFLAACASVVCLAATAVIPGDARKGAELFQSQKCVTCHSVNGEGGKTAPDLGRKSGKKFMPSDLAALMWNHAPAMWSAMDKAGIQRPSLNNEQAADLFAYFYAARYFDQPGDAGRGRKLFVAKSCSTCHNLSSGGQGPPVSNWDSVVDPIELARQMWNHSGKMREAMSGSKTAFPTLTGAEMNDIIVYLQNLPQTKNLKPNFSPASAETGETLFQVKGCASCHKDVTHWSTLAIHNSPSDLAAAMWNHAADMKQTPTDLRPEEMRRLVGYLWSVQHTVEGGNAAAGHKVYAEKGCQGCHGDKVPIKTDASAYNMVASLWAHGPTMLQEMKTKSVAWPHFTGVEMANLLAFAATK
jgi:mono/diheme cytochrome c family protein